MRIMDLSSDVCSSDLTPSSVDVRANHPIDPDWFESIATPGWQQRWLENFTLNQTGGLVEEDLVMDGWTDLARRILGRIASLEGPVRSEERRVGKECVRTGKYRWSPLP